MPSIRRDNTLFYTPANTPSPLIQVNQTNDVRSAIIGGSAKTDNHTISQVLSPLISSTNGPNITVSSEEAALQLRN
jgi:hypothetical protein